MKRVLTSLIVTICVLVALSGVMYAHHGRGSTYDAKKVVDLKGTINKVMWRNPHIQFLVDVNGPDGKVTTWTIEHSNVSTLARLGYDRTTLKPGMEVFSAIPGLIQHTSPRGFLSLAMRMWIWRKSHVQRTSMFRTCIMTISTHSS